MALSEIIADLEHDESVAFTRGVMCVRFVAKKGDDRFGHEEIKKRVDLDDLKQGSIDLLSVEVRRAFEILRR